MVHVDIKKVGTIPDGSGWFLHGRGKKPKTSRPGYSYLHSAVDGFSRLAYTEVVDNEIGLAAANFLTNARAFFAAHGIKRIERIVTDNRVCYRSEVFTQAVTCRSRHQRIAPYAPKHNGKVERYNRIMVEELLYARPFTSEAQRREAIVIWNVHYNFHRSYLMCAGQPPVSALRRGVANVHSSYI